MIDSNVDCKKLLKLKPLDLNDTLSSIERQTKDTMQTNNLASQRLLATESSGMVTILHYS